MGNRVVLTVHEGAIRPRRVTKPQAPRKLHQWISAARQRAREWRSQHFAFRYDGRWHVFDVDQTEPLKAFPVNAPQDAVEMWLLAKGMING